MTVTTVNSLIHVSCNPTVKHRLQSEAEMLLPSKYDVVSKEKLKLASFTKKSIKETLRITPTAPAVGRIINDPLELHGYFIPENVSKNIFY